MSKGIRLSSLKWSKLHLGKNIIQMFADCWYTHIKQLRHSLLRTPHSFITVHDLHTIFLPLNLKDQELHRAVSYLKLLRHNGRRSVKTLDIGNIDIHSLFKQKLRRLPPVNILQTNSHRPVARTFLHTRFPGSKIQLKLRISVFLWHISPNN